MSNLFTCRDCGEEKTRSQMCAEKRLKHGVTKQCKACRSKQRYLNGEYMRERLRKYGYRKAGGGMSRITLEEMQTFMKKKTCSYCGVKLTLGNGDATEQCVDHVYPISDKFDGYGGENIALNLVTCCRSCNASKRNDHVYDFFTRAEKFTPILWTAFVAEYTKRMIGRELCAVEIEQIKRGFAEEAAELRAIQQREKGAAG